MTAGATDRTVSLVSFAPTADAALATIVAAEAAGVPTLWLPTYPMSWDPMPVLAFGAARTERIRLGTAIVPTYPRHPAALAGEAMSIAALAPGRFVLGVGASHAFIVNGMYGMPYDRPLAHTREYLHVLRALLTTGQVEVAGRFYTVRGALPPGMPPVPVPVPVAALRPRMFRTAGELADGAIAAWCPLEYLRDVARPALVEGAKAADRPVPPLVAGMAVVYHTDREAARAAARRALAAYQHVPAYQEMFAQVGMEFGPAGIPDAVVDAVTLYGDDDAIAEQVRALHEAGVDDVALACCPVADPVGEQLAVLRLLGRLAS
jgi:F420-dependent oxidoreductase-like protein